MSIASKATMLPLHQRCSHELWWRYKEQQYSVKNWLTIGEQSAERERERSTKTFTDGWQLHPTGIEPMSIAWKATMLPLHQRCSNENLLLYKEKQSSCFKNWLTIGEKKCRDKTLHQNNRQRITIASYGNRTEVNSLEGYYATTTPTMLTWTLVMIQGVTVLFCQKLIDDRRAKCRERTQHQNIYWRMTIASYGNRTRVNSLEGYYATPTPTMLTSCDYTMRNSPLVSKTDWRSERKSAERKRCTKTFTNGWQLHRTGIEPMSIA